MKIRARTLFTLWAALLLMPACGQEASPFEPPQEEVVQLDTLKGLDLGQLKSLVSVIQKGDVYPDVHSLLIMREGELVLEEYFNGSSQAELHTMQSVSKSITGALIGIALDRGDMPGLETHVLDFFPEWKDDLASDARRAAMTLEDVLTMRTGTDYHESGANSPHSQLNALSTGWDRFWLNRPMISTPGTKWQYDSGGVIALSSMLRNSAGEHADLYARDALFWPLGVGQTRWAKNAEGHPHTGGGLQMRSVDLLRFGQMVLQGGRWEGEQIIPSEWIEASMRRRVTFSPPIGGSGKLEGYGYLWWLLSPDPDGDGQQEIWGALGYAGQSLFVIPEHDMVVVITAWAPSEPGITANMLYAHVLPAVLR